MKKNYMITMLLLFCFMAKAQNFEPSKKVKNGELTTSQNEKSLYSNEQINILQEEVTINEVNYLDVKFVNKTDQTIEVDFVGRFSFYTKEFCDVCIWDQPEYKAIYTLTIEANQTFSSLSLKDFDDKVITPSNLFVAKSFDLSNLKDFKVFVNEINTKN